MSSEDWALGYFPFSFWFCSFSLLAPKSKKSSYQNFLPQWFNFLPSTWILLKFFLTKKTFIFYLFLTLSTYLYSGMRQVGLFSDEACVFASRWQCTWLSMGWAWNSVKNRHGLCRDIGAILDMSRKTKWVLTIWKEKKSTLCSKSTTWLKLELCLRPWPQLFYPFPCKEVCLSRWLILCWMGYRPLTYLISGSGPEHNSLFTGASEKVTWICRGFL